MKSSSFLPQDAVIELSNDPSPSISRLMLFHVSEEPGITRFVPRPSEYAPEPLVWAIQEARLCNYLLPRDCPRVTFYAGPNTTRDDAQQFLQSAPAVVAVESRWLERLRSCTLYCYRLPTATFECMDECAGYYVSREAVVPESVQIVEDVMSELLRRRIELRFVESLWPLRDAVVESSLQFSLIRMRNAVPRIPLDKPSEMPT